MLAFISPGPLELLVVVLVILLLFGNRLPGVMRSLGRGIVEFKKGLSGTEETTDHSQQANAPSQSSKP